jgi:hypothetical protein
MKVNFKSPDVSINEPLWSALENRVRNRLPLPTYLKQPEDVLQEEWYKIPLGIVKTYRSPFQEGLRLY